jgi:large subunit ribosomal protein L21
MSSAMRDRPLDGLDVLACKANDRLVKKQIIESQSNDSATARIRQFAIKTESAILLGSVGIRPRSQVKEVNMYAVIKTGGKQYRVAAGEKIKVEQIAADVGQEIVIDQVLAVGNGAELKVGTPLVSGATVKATIVAHGKHDKVRIFKMRRRKHYQKRQGHRQQFTELQIGAIAA